MKLFLLIPECSLSQTSVIIGGCKSLLYGCVETESSPHLYQTNMLVDGCKNLPYGCVERDSSTSISDQCDGQWVREAARVVVWKLSPSHIRPMC